MTSRRQARFVYEWAPWLLVLCIAGYPFVGMVGALLNLDSSTLSVPFRVGIVLLSVAWLIHRPGRVEWLRGHRWLLAFLGLYLLRLIWDWLVAGIPGAAEALVFFVATVLLPGFALTLSGASAIPPRLTAWRFMVVGGATCILVSAMQYFGWGVARMVDMDITGGRVYFEAVNPISLGHAATTTLIAVLSVSFQPMRPLRRLALLAAGAAAASTLLLAASRGPLLALVICTIAFGIATGRWRWIALITVALVSQLLSADSLLVERLSTGAEDESSLERLLVQGAAIAQFLDRPILGSAFTELQSLEYPHNLFIETGMALGLVGLIVMVMLIYVAGVQFVRRLRAGEVLVPLLLLQYFVAIQFSGSLWGSTSFWALMAVVLGLHSARAPRRPALACRMQARSPAAHALANAPATPTP